MSESDPELSNSQSSKMSTCTSDSRNWRLLQGTALTDQQERRPDRGMSGRRPIVGREMSVMAASIARLKASARPMAGSRFNSENISVVIFTAVWLSTHQCETRSARALASKKARAKPESGSASPFSPPCTTSGLGVSCRTFRTVCQ